jgi:hypothetical protein
MVKAETLENVVWNKFCEAVKNPCLITEQVARLKDKALKNRDNIVGSIESIDRKLKDTENEETRLLDAYRENIISMDQLKKQMVKVQAKKKQLEEEKRVLVIKQENTFSPILVKKSIIDYCKLLEKRLDSPKDDFEGKKYLLSLAVNKIVLDGNTVRIKGILPTYIQGRPVFSDIVSMTSGRCAHLQQLPQMPFWHVPGL